MSRISSLVYGLVVMISKRSSRSSGIPSALIFVDVHINKKKLWRTMRALIIGASYFGNPSIGGHDEDGRHFIFKGAV
jgi:hypothetical protein